MKKGILIGAAVLVLAALAWFGGRRLFGSKEGDASSESTEVSEQADVSSNDAGAAETEASGATVSGTETEEAASDDAGAEALSEGTEAEEAGALSEDAEDKPADDAETAAEGGAGEEAEESEAQDIAEVAALPSDENTLYTIKTSDGNNLGMVPIVNGNAVVLMDGGSGMTYQGEYVPEEQSALRMKLEEQTTLAASEGKIGPWAFYRESAMRDFVFPEGVTAIEKFAFARSGLTGIAIPEGVTSIGSGAFYHCDSLTDVVIPDSVTVIEENAFSHTPWLENWMAEGTGGSAEEAEATENSDTGDFLIVGDGILLAYRGSEEDPVLPPEVKSIAPGVFGN